MHIRSSKEGWPSAILYCDAVGCPRAALPDEMLVGSRRLNHHDRPGPPGEWTMVDLDYNYYPARPIGPFLLCPVCSSLDPALTMATNPRSAGLTLRQRVGCEIIRRWLWFNNRSPEIAIESATLTETRSAADTRTGSEPAEDDNHNA